MGYPFRIAAVLLAVLVAAALGFVAFAWRGAIDPAPVPARSAFAAEQVRAGAQLSAIGGCASCHTREGGEPLAGGVPLRTPFGTLYGSNITPDAAYGIGQWSLPAFTRAMRQGVARDGSHLYPAFPYDHYRHLGDADIAALYAFVMTRDAVALPAPPHALTPPFGWRPLLAGWKLLFVDRSEPRADLALQDTSEKRGAYLVQALAHCGACHTPRNKLGAEIRSRPFAGGEAEGWYAPPLDATSPSPVTWTVAAMNEYLRTGLTAGHAIAGGPMQPVVAGLARADAADVDAIARRVVALMGPPTPARQQRERDSLARAQAPSLLLLAPQPAQPQPNAKPASAASAASGGNDARLQAGATVYATACAQCHDLGRGLSSGSGLRLPLAVAVHEADPRSLLRIVREGIQPLPGTTGRWMPGYGGLLTNAQIEALAVYLRVQAAGLPPWDDLAHAVAQSAENSTR